ncbi:HPr family phosphocarrier protein [Vibrio quintilis]|uniref:Multiphosphoryl transfer protein n=1 Tax=Vibrio quintilis TaxID=1117707 RepID=A0A1M7Z1K0_9VIBR|nr:HPr family phosphocarrier protein [Vibrio quintilis]SHO58751.1 Multiphosphoryl transfer protein [Vibrio quintilis]
MAENTVELEAKFIIENKSGLHTRPGAMLVQIAKQFDCDISITNLTSNGKPENAKSLMRLMTCGIKRGHEILVTLQGHDAKSALEAISKGIQSGLGE